MTAPLATQAEVARTLWSQGALRKEIARRTGLSERAVGRICADLPKPFEHRGRKLTATATRLFHREDYEL